MMKKWQDNNKTNCTDPVYIENETELSWPIQQGMVYDKDNIGQRNNWSYRCGLRINQN